VVVLRVQVAGSSQVGRLSALVLGSLQPEAVPRLVEV
jgi:hypothetical protein